MVNNLRYSYKNSKISYKNSPESFLFSFMRLLCLYFERKIKIRLKGHFSGVLWSVVNPDPHNTHPQNETRS